MSRTIVRSETFQTTLVSVIENPYTRNLIKIEYFSYFHSAILSFENCGRIRNQQPSKPSEPIFIRIR